MIPVFRELAEIKEQTKQVKLMLKATASKQQPTSMEIDELFKLPITTHKEFETVERGLQEKNKRCELVS
jgi:hypothetical protein